MENGYFERELSVHDRLMNHFVRLALLARGSGRLFSSKRACEEYLKTAQCKPVDLPTGERKGITVFKEKYCDTEYYIFKPKAEANSKTVVMYLHGGAYVRRLTSHHVRLIEKLCRKTGCIFVVPLYLTLPEYSCRESLEQLLEIYRTLTEKYENVVLCGDSCGGAICVNLLPFIEQSGLKKPKKLILFSPFLDHRVEGDAETEKIAKHDPMFCGTGGLGFLAECWCEGFEKDDPCAEPACAEFKSGVPVCIFTSGGDMLSAGCKRFFEKGTAAGAPIRLVYFEKTYHCFVLYPLDAARFCMNETAKLITEE